MSTGLTAQSWLETDTARKVWKSRITTAWGRAIGQFVAVGALLIQAKADIKRGAFCHMCNNDLPFSGTIARELMIIARDSRLHDPVHLQQLPAKIEVLAKLTKLDDGQFAAALEAGNISPKMRAQDVRNLLGLPDGWKSCTGAPGPLDVSTPFGKSVGACTREELQALATRRARDSLFFALLSADLAPLQVCKDNVTSERCAALRSRADQASPECSPPAQG